MVILTSNQNVKICMKYKAKALISPNYLSHFTSAQILDFPSNVNKILFQRMIFHRSVCYIAVHLNVKIQIGFWKLVGKIRILKTWKSNHKTLVNLRAVYEYLNSFWLLMLSSCQLILKTNRSMIPLSWNYDTVTKKQKHKKELVVRSFMQKYFLSVLSFWKLKF